MRCRQRERERERDREREREGRREGGRVDSPSPHTTFSKISDSNLKTLPYPQQNPQIIHESANSVIF